MKSRKKRQNEKNYLASQCGTDLRLAMWFKHVSVAIIHIYDAGESLAAV